MMSNTGSVCWDSLQQPVSPGQYFTPVGKDFCQKCKCLAGKAVGCFFEKCTQLPDCDRYKPVQGTCCEFECLQDNGLSDKTELAVVFSLSAGLVLLLIILVLVLYCQRQGMKKSQEESTEKTKTQTAPEQPQPQSASTTNSQGAAASNSETNTEEHVELPPPYSPAPHSTVASGGRNKSPPNEPPPPYADREESAV